MVVDILLDRFKGKSTGKPQKIDGKNHGTVHGTVDVPLNQPEYGR